MMFAYVHGSRMPRYLVLPANEAAGTYLIQTYFESTETIIDVALQPPLEPASCNWGRACRMLSMYSNCICGLFSIAGMLYILISFTRM